MTTRLFECGDTAALVTYEYGESAPEERAAIAAHLRDCAACAAEVEALAATRRQLAAWTPPELAPFVAVPPAAAAPAPVLRPARWWRRPVPRWAQAAAAVLLFAGGVSMGGAAGLWLGAPEDGSALGSAAPGVSSQDLTALENRLRAEIAALRNAAATPVPVAASAAESGVIEQVRDLIQASEARQRREFDLRTADLLRDFDAQRRVDQARVEESLGQLQGVTGAEVAEQRRLLDYLIRVSQQQ